MANEFVQTMADARVDAQSLSDFVFKPSGFKVARRLAPTIDTLQFYINRFNSLNGDFSSSVSVALSSLNSSVAEAEGKVVYIETTVQDAINNTAIEGGILADTFVVVDGSTNQRVINRGVESVAEMLAISDPKTNLRVYVKSYHAGLGIGGDYFIYDSSKSDINNDVTVINGWVREEKEVYLVEDAGVSVGNADNTELYSKLIEALPEGSRIKWGDKDGEYVGTFISNKSFNLDVNDAILKPIYSADNTNIIAFIRVNTQLSVVETSLPKYSDKFTVSGVTEIKSGDLVSLYDRMTRPHDGQAVHFETVEVASVNTVEGNTEVTLKDSLLSPFTDDNIVCYWFSNPIKTPSVSNINLIDNDINISRCIYFEGCLNPKTSNIVIKNNYGHATSFYYCVGAESNNFYCDTPRNPGVGGYGLVFNRCRHITVDKAHGHKTRHVVDLDSCYGHIDIYDVRDNDAQSAVVGLGHNGFANGHIIIDKVEGRFVGDNANPVIRCNRQGLSNLDLPSHKMDFIKVTNVTQRIAGSGSSAQYYPFYSDIFSGAIICDGLTVIHETQEARNKSGKVNAGFRFRGEAESITISNVKADVCQRAFLVQNSETNNVGVFIARNIDVSNNESFSLCRGFALDVDGFVYDDFASDIKAAITYQEQGLSKHISSINVKNVKHRYGDPAKTVQSVKRSYFTNKVYGVVDYAYKNNVNLSVTTGQSIDYDTFYDRMGGVITIMSDGDVTLAGLPPTIVSDGMVVYIQNLTGHTITIPSSSNNQPIEIAPTQLKVIVSRAGLWTNM